ncbi:hypothetical protein [Falsibacillus pallidus]|uniref:hypothetical protein n=1 Tax=Falsibacillus pallidus TaxID=493781 RepID=UPI003D9803AB
MSQEDWESKLNALQNGELKEFQVLKDEFLAFREFLVKRSDFKHFQGTAQRGGNVTYIYSDTPRS